MGPLCLDKPDMWSWIIFDTEFQFTGTSCVIVCKMSWRLGDCAGQILLKPDWTCTGLTCVCVCVCVCVWFKPDKSLSTAIFTLCYDWPFPPLKHFKTAVYLWPPFQTYFLSNVSTFQARFLIRANTSDSDSSHLTHMDHVSKYVICQF